MFRPFARRVVERLPAIPTRRYALAGIVVVLGMALSVVVWFRAENQRQVETTTMLDALNDRSTSEIEWSMRREFEGLTSFAQIWRVHDPDSSETWPAEAGILLEHFPAIRWIAWVSADTTVLASVGRKGPASVDTLLLRQARLQLGAPTNSFVDRWTDAYEFNVTLPLRTGVGKVSALIAEFRFDEDWVARERVITGFCSIRLIADKGESVHLVSLPDSLAPPWMRMRRSLTSPTGTTMQVEWAPSDEFVRQVMTTWPGLFVLVGGLFSVALGALLISFLRQRDFSVALQGTNRQLDARIEDLSSRDREMNQLNNDLSERVQQRTAALTQALRELETLNHSVSHDLRSPIGAIMNFTALLEEDFGPRLEREERRYLERIRSAAARANQLLDSLSEYMASDAQPKRSDLLDMTTLARVAMTEAQGRDGDEAAVEFELEPLPAALGDSALVHRVFVNLLGNALKYSRGRDPRVVRVTGAAEDHESSFHVTDNGSGFAPGKTDEVFQPFRRLHDNDIEGSGLGLAIVAKLIGGMGGRVWADSDGSTTTTFSFTLPRAPEDCSHEETDTSG